MIREFPCSGKLHHRGQLLRLLWNLPLPGQRVGVDARGILGPCLWAVSVFHSPPRSCLPTPTNFSIHSLPGCTWQPCRLGILWALQYLPLPSDWVHRPYSGPGPLRPGFHPLWTQFWHMESVQAKQNAPRWFSPSSAVALSTAQWILRDAIGGISAQRLTTAQPVLPFSVPLLASSAHSPPHSPWFPPTSLPHILENLYNAHDFYSLNHSSPLRPPGLQSDQ